MRRTLRIGVLVSDPYHYNAGALVQTALVRLGVYDDAEFTGLTGGAGAEVIDTLKTGNGAFYEWRDEQELKELLMRQRLTHLLSDDHLPRLRVASRASRAAGIKHLVYAHIFSGLSAISRNLPSSSFASAARNALGGLVPFRGLTAEYVSLLRKAERVFPNSGFTQALLGWLYGVVSGPVAYPIVDEEFRRDRPIDQDTPQPGAAIYFGNRGELSREVIARAASFCRRMMIPHVEGFGDIASSEEFAELFEGKSVMHKRPLSSEELAQLFSRSSVTIAPQTFEGFGLVGPESILVGTPILLANYQPWLEITGPGNFCQFLRDDPCPNRAGRIPEKKTKELRAAREKLREALSPEAFARRLIGGLTGQ
jgi:hypothetical protein